LARPKPLQKGMIFMDVREIGIDGSNRIRLARDRVKWRNFVSAIMNLQVP